MHGELDPVVGEPVLGEVVGADLLSPLAATDLQAAGGARPEVDMRDELLKADLDRTARERAADEQLDLLKKKLGKKE